VDVLVEVEVEVLVEVDVLVLVDVEVEVLDVVVVDELVAPPAPAPLELAEPLVASLLPHPIAANATNAPIPSARYFIRESLRPKAIRDQAPARRPLKVQPGCPITAQ
jgi:hypothetical protein